MKTYNNLLGMVLFFAIALTSCTKEAIITPTPPCELTSENIVIEPICSFNPKVQTTTAFPVQVLYNGESISHTNFEFNWSSDADFGGSAISISYDELPLTLTLIEKATDCEATAMLEQSYWD